MNMADGTVPRDVYLAAVRVATGAADRVSDADRDAVRAWAKEWSVSLAVRAVLLAAADRGVAAERE